MARNIVISGAAGGIGRALLPMLADDNLLLIDRAESGVEGLAAEIGAKGVAATPLTPDDCRAAMNGIDGQIDGLVHLAGTFEPDPELGDDPTIYPRTMQNGLENAYSFATAIAERLPTDQTGRVVFISSLAFRRGGGDHVADLLALLGQAGVDHQADVQALELGHQAHRLGARARHLVGRALVGGGRLVAARLVAERGVLGAE